LHQAEVIRVRTQLLVTTGRDPEIVFKAQASTARPIDSRLDGQNHVLANRPCARLVGKGRFVGARAYTVADRMRRLTWIASLCKTSTDKAIEIGQACPIPRKRRRFLEDAQ
jgi:hypothetical protein